MKKLFKILLYILLSLAVLIGLAIGCLLMFFNPNDYKDQLEKLALEKTHHALHLNGNISLAFWPSIGLHLRDVTFDNNATDFPNTKPLLTFKDAEVSLAVLPLLHKQFEVNTVSLISPEINLIKTAKNKTNWGDLLTPKTPEKQKDENAVPSNLNFSANINIKNGTLTYEDRTTGKTTTITGLGFGARVVKENSPYISLYNGHMEANSINLSPLEITNFNTKFTLKDHELTIKPLDMTLPGGAVKSETTIHLHDENTAQFAGVPVINFQGKIDSLAVDQLLKGMNPSSDQKPITMKDLNINATIRTNEAIKQSEPDNIKKYLVIHGGAQVGSIDTTLEKGTLKLSGIDDTFDMANGIFQSTLKNASLYGGTITATTSTDLGNESQRTRLNANITNVQVGDLLDALMDSRPLEGAAHLTLKNLTINGNDKASIMNGLNGMITYEITKGSSKYLQTAAEGVQTAIEAAQTAGFIDEDEKIDSSGEFTHFKGEGNFKDGVLSHDINIEAALGELEVEGNYNLKNSSVDYNVDVTLPVTEHHLKLKGTLNGPAQKPSPKFNLLGSALANPAIIQKVGTKALEALGIGSGEDADEDDDE